MPGSDLLKSLDDEARKKLKKAGHPQWTDPMLATLTGERFSRKDWIYERKLDGERCLAFREGGRIRLLSRNRKKINDSYPELEEPFLSQDEKDFVVDGEIVAFEGGLTSFSRLQDRMNVSSREEARSSGVAVNYYLFDILHLDGYDLTGLPQRTRKGILRSALSFEDPLRFLPHRNREGEKYWKEACGKGWEGVIAKQAGHRYVHGRSKKWLKFKCVREQELVIGGYTEPEGSRKGFGALLLGWYDGDDLVYAGKVGTGFDEDMLESLSGRMESIERKTPPFDRGDIPKKGVHWITPKLVGQVAFTEWTGDGRLRHPRFKGLRRDKDPKKVVRENR